MSFQNNKGQISGLLSLINIILGNFTSEIIRLLLMRFLGEVPLNATGTQWQNPNYKVQLLSVGQFPLSLSG